jgi:hypothetical protein
VNNPMLDPLELHHQVTCGLTLTPEEQRLLDAWYAEQDQLESKQLGSSASPQAIAALHTQIQTALAQLIAVTQRIQELTTQNEELRREVAVLKHQLIQQVTIQAV